MSDCGSCQTFVEEFVRGTDARRIPMQATIELTYRCNFDCVHCYNVKHWVGGELGIAEWERVFDQLAEAGCLIITFTGGEPLVHPEFFEVVEAAKARRFAWKLNTNASLITEERADRIAALQPLQVDVSLYGPDEDVFAAVVLRTGAFEKTVAGIRRLTARGLKVVLKFPLLRENFDARMRMEALARELGCLMRANIDVTPKDDGDRSPQAHAITGEQMVQWIKQTWRERPERHYGENSQLCRPGEKAVAIGPHGDLYPCIQIKKSMGNLRHQSFRDIWEGSAPLEEIRSLRARDFEVCNECSAFGNCKPCLGTALLETGSLTAPNSEACRRESIRALLPILG